MTEKRIRKLKYDIQRSRSRIIDIHPAFAGTLQNLTYVADSSVYHISTNGLYICFDPDWLGRLREEELDFVLAHQVMHIKLRHIDRELYYKGERFHLACDIIANAYLNEYGWGYDSLAHIGTIYKKTFYPAEYGLLLSPEEAMKMVPFDPALETKSRRRYVFDSDMIWSDRSYHGENGTIILAPGEEDPFDTGKIYEEEHSLKIYRKKKKKGAAVSVSSSSESAEAEDYDIDYEPLRTWDKKSSDDIKAVQWAKEEDTADAEADEQTRAWKQLRRSRLNWRKLLNVFVREELCDYSFTPPDRRFQDDDFFLPDYNVIDEKTKNILFMVDTSASVGDDILSVVYSELCSALYQFGDSLEGTLAFFDSRVYRPVRFSSISELKSIRPIGGGTTDFSCIFDHVRNKMMNDPPLSIVIFTDGKGDLPSESAAMNIPVLWMITNTHFLPEWGKCVVVEK